MLGIKRKQIMRSLMIHGLAIEPHSAEWELFVIGIKTAAAIVSITRRITARAKNFFLNSALETLWWIILVPIYAIEISSYKIWRTIITANTIYSLSHSLTPYVCQSWFFPPVLMNSVTKPFANLLSKGVLRAFNCEIKQIRFINIKVREILLNCLSWWKDTSRSCW